MLIRRIAALSLAGIVSAGFVAAVLAAPGYATPARADPVGASEARKIEFLIAAVESLHDAQFIRNGTAYDAKSAADHLRMKWRSAGSKAATAADFIRNCASVSSTSKLPYMIRFADGHSVTAEAYLWQRLSEYQEGLSR